MLKFTFAELPQEYRPGLEALAPEIGLCESPDGMPVYVKSGEGVSLCREGEAFVLSCAGKSEFFRGLTLLCRYAKEGEVSVSETPRFDKCGLMPDCSRNAVLKPDSVKYLLRRMALAGMNWMMLYTEDTYTVPERPYFGYLRGRYSFEELKGLDDYADMLGIEMIPCIQTLAHLERALQWPVMAEYRDTDDVLLTGEREPKTYEFIRQCIRAASAPFRSKRIHIGMDEAYWMGRGQYLNKYGYASKVELMRNHLKLVKEILDEEGLEAMMWSDMHFTAARDEGVYHPDCILTLEILAAAPENIGLVYWDYYHEDNASYANMLQKHAQFKAKTIFAGGIWTWCGPAADYRKTLAATLPALEECVKAGVKEVFATCWGDDGAECNLYTLQYGLAIFGEYNYTGHWDAEEAEKRFRASSGMDAQAFLTISKLNELPGLVRQPNSTANPCRVLLYEDPLLPLFEADLPRNEEYIPYYEELAAKFEAFARENEPMHLQLEAYACMARALVLKCRWRMVAAPAVRNGDRQAAKELLSLAEENLEALRALRRAWYNQWMAVNKPFGFEVLDIRLGGAIARFETARDRMAEFAQGLLEDIPELREEKLPYQTDEEGQYVCRNLWAHMVTPSRMGQE